MGRHFETGVIHGRAAAVLAVVSHKAGVGDRSHLDAAVVARELTYAHLGSASRGDRTSIAIACNVAVKLRVGHRQIGRERKEGSAVGPGCAFIGSILVTARTTET